MARAVRVEFAGAFYHVMARGDRREAIVRDDVDRASFVRTLPEAGERSGFRVHAFVLMSNHYHLLLETPQANRSRGMGWLQNAFTRRINTRHALWGHLFGGRYKAILVEPGNCFWALLDYIHLNPVRAGVVAEKDGLESYVWSSLPHYLGLRASDPPGWKPRWVSTSADAMIRPVDGGSISACWSGGWTGAIPVGLGQPSRGRWPAAVGGVFKFAAGLVVRFGALPREAAQEARQAADSNGEGQRLPRPATQRLCREARAGAHSSRLGTLWIDLATLRRARREISAKG